MFFPDFESFYWDSFRILLTEFLAGFLQEIFPKFINNFFRNLIQWFIGIAFQQFLSGFRRSSSRDCFLKCVPIFLLNCLPRFLFKVFRAPPWISIIFPSGIIPRTIFRDNSVFLRMSPELPHKIFQINLCGVSRIISATWNFERRIS